MSGEGSRFTPLIVFLLVEFVVFVIALLMPVTPSKTGSDGSLADHFFEEPTYLQEVLVYFVFGHAVLAVMALVGLILWKRERSRSSDAP